MAGRRPLVIGLTNKAVGIATNLASTQSQLKQFGDHETKVLWQSSCSN